VIIDPVIYVITNVINDKQYVGQAINKNKRWRDHRIMLKAGKHKNRHLQYAYNKYGSEKFIYTTLEIIIDISKLNEREQYWINALNCIDPKGYNLIPTAGSAIGFKHSEETKLNWSKQRKGQKRSEEFKLKISKSWETRIVSNETKANMALAQLGKTQTEETKLKRANSLKGNKNNTGKKRLAPTSEETRKKISEAKKAGYAKRKAALDKG
jgi:group I intron endonuclease